MSATFKFRGDFARLNKMANQIEQLASREFRRRAALMLREEALELTQQRFDDGKDPYGMPWKPSQRAIKDGGLTLVDTAVLRNSINRGARSDAMGFTIGTSVKYARVHNEGGVITRQARSELRRYKVGRNDKRTRIGLYSKAKNSITKGVSVWAGSFKMPKRQFLPSSHGYLPVEYRRRFTSALLELRSMTFGGL